MKKEDVNEEGRCGNWININRELRGEDKGWKEIEISGKIEEENWKDYYESPLEMIFGSLL